MSSDDDVWHTVESSRGKAKSKKQMKQKQVVRTAPAVVSPIGPMVPIETVTQGQLRFNQPTNKQMLSSGNVNKLSENTDAGRHKTLSMEIAKLIVKGREAKGISQKELAAKIYERLQVVVEYETGKAIPDSKILSKIEKVIEIKLLGKNIGDKLVRFPKTGGAELVLKGGKSARGGARKI
ncbi:endothelial differentiation-related factor 1-like [Teleopsis dalmanni]|uniref:endothelial differentiation-related factor 1-like n=1 Tax=Teleopsis dalmanni TaxID=139649 RepID=UPI0018CEDFF1|nr:endothelial differentiation-related factor 1-like [Teleopsis dalmanni]XP_037927415.1 endothelial differentiation-related factor 1-like [Teleopsis dalmanni]XP_037927416.1 endothelial differentiation-related factor 1-like [Teleopsis dalmanni]XP_037927417.1 endothelial differentiation-related factor 1-like [Teleopsis dalmanni]XP_037927418.1 endothelial differentiation-related factor 1-like [Teleopsis dalmanni]